MKNKDINHIVAALLLAVIVLWGTYFMIDKKVSEIVRNEVLEVEYDKVWGKENYDFMKKSTTQQLNAYREQYGDDIPEANNNAPEQKKEENTSMTVEKAKSIKEGAYILWNSDAEITFVEYSDLECPFCKKLHSAGTIGKILDTYEWKVNFIFKHFPLDFHPMAQMEAEAAECVWELAGDKVYHNFIEEIFKNSETNGKSYTKESISDLAGTIGLDKNKVLSCIESGKYTQKVKDQMAEWAEFGVTWTPWNVIIDNRTWEYKLLPWAYPFDNFKGIIDGFLNK